MQRTSCVWGSRFEPIGEQGYDLLLAVLYEVIQARGVASQQVYESRSGDK